MCGIVGYVGDKPVLDVVIEGLRRLEYRGYDSAGVAVIAADGMASAEEGRQAGQPREAARTSTRCPPATVGMGHTRWATHGAPTDRNAHPHMDDSGRVAVIHNGIIENFASLRTELEGRGRDFRSDTDTEVAAHLLSEAYEETGDLADAMRAVCRRLEGAFTLRRGARRRARTSSSVPGATARWSSASATARTSSAATSPRSSRTRGTPSSSDRTRSWSCAATA